MKITSEGISFGYDIYNGAVKLAVVVNHHNQGLQRNGATICEAMPKDMWVIHWCSPRMSVVEAMAVMEHVATLPEYVSPNK